MSQKRLRYVMYANGEKLPLSLDLRYWKFGTEQFELSENQVLTNSATYATGRWINPLTPVEFTLWDQRLYFSGVDYFALINLPDGFLVDVTWTPQGGHVPLSRSILFSSGIGTRPKSAVIAPSEPFSTRTLNVSSREWMRTSELEEDGIPLAGPMDVTLFQPYIAPIVAMRHPGELLLLREDQQPPTWG